MGVKREKIETPVDATELRREMIIAWEEITKRLATTQLSLEDPSVTEQHMHYEPPAKQQVALFMSQWGAEQGGGRTFNFNLTGIKHPGKSDKYNTDWFFAPTLEVFDRTTAHGYKDRGGNLVEIVADDGVTMTLRFKPDHPACAFRSFTTLSEGCLFHLKNLRDNYNSAWTAVTQFADETNLGPLSIFTDRLAAKRYFTGSKKTYLTNTSKYYNEYVKAADGVWEEAFHYAELRRH
jgi:hypothetical protein